MKLYIAGKITGDNNYKEKFAKKEKELEKFHNVVNPVKLCKDDWDWKTCMKKCIVSLVECDKVYFLADYKESRGAMIEFNIARNLGMEMIFE
jgi:hypothetical protein